MKYVMTGATGFLGNELLRLLVVRGQVTAIVRSKESGAALPQVVDEKYRDHVNWVLGDVTSPRCGLKAADTRSLEGSTFVHCAGMYDLDATAEECEKVNVQGTAHALECAKAMHAESFHHVSSVAVAGSHRGAFSEAMFDVGQSFDHPYFSSKFASEKLVRETTDLPWRIYRPSMIVGSSITGAIARADGPYYVFPVIRTLRDMLPSWVPLIGPEGGTMNVVPVDFVATAMDYLIHRPKSDQKTFHIIDPLPMTLGGMLSTLATVAHGPDFAIRLDRRLGSIIPKSVRDIAGSAPAIQRLRKQLLSRFGIPEMALTYLSYNTKLEGETTSGMLEAGGIVCPSFVDYAATIWDYWDRHLDPTLLLPQHVSAAVVGKHVMITGASSGIGAAVAMKLGAAGATVILVARRRDELEALAEQIRAEGGIAVVAPADLSSHEGATKLIQDVLDEHDHIDVLINNAGRSIRRSVVDSLERFHDFERTMQLNYFGSIALIMAVLPSMQQRQTGHIINVSSIGVQSCPPRFSAYVASKSALDGFSRCFAAEVAHDGIDVSTVHMPLVRTPMIAPTSMYRRFPTISPEEAADMVVRAIMGRTPDVSTTLGRVATLMGAIAPTAHHLLMSAAYSIFPDSAGAKDGIKKETGKQKEELSLEAYALSEIMRGVHF